MALKIRKTDKVFFANKQKISFILQMVPKVENTNEESFKNSSTDFENT